MTLEEVLAVETEHPESRPARDVLHDRHGTFAHERNGHRVGAHAVARDARRRHG